jgi:ABC-type sugar transport system ATPase subunit
VLAPAGWRRIGATVRGWDLCDEPLSNLDADQRERMRVEISG